ncbi:uncharacterized protein LOC129138037 isoform X2 [Pan troglodytes]|uniref:uncharacterized protein LOC129138037 isoform X2 n=1 Tax=Pan troglodytes TaxID=9598 RepID=UPI00301407A1
MLSVRGRTSRDRRRSWWNQPDLAVAGPGPVRCDSGVWDPSSPGAARPSVLSAAGWGWAGSWDSGSPVLSLRSDCRPRALSGQLRISPDCAGATGGSWGDPASGLGILWEEPWPVGSPVPPFPPKAAPASP